MSEAEVLDWIPPMLSNVEVAERERQDDLRVFRQHLVDSGAVHCLVNLFKHTIKHELRMDNPQLLHRFFESYFEEDNDVKEQVHALRAENVLLKRRNKQLRQHTLRLSQELIKWQRSNVGHTIYKELLRLRSLPEEQVCADHRMTVQTLFEALCGSHLDSTRTLADLVRPKSFNKKELGHDVIPGFIAFRSWLADVAPESVYVWCRDILAPKLEAPCRSGEPLFQHRETLESVDVHVGLGEFLLAAADQFGAHSCVADLVDGHDQ